MVRKMCKKILAENVGDDGDVRITQNLRCSGIAKVTVNYSILLPQCVLECMSTTIQILLQWDPEYSLCCLK